MPDQPTIFLSSDNPSHVTSRGVVDVFIGTPSKRMLIFSGIAMFEATSEGLLDHYPVEVDLKQNVNSGIGNVNAVLSYTASVGLASISNEDSDFLFATDDVSVFIGDDGNLRLLCHTAVLGTGETSTLNRFSYQTTVLVDSQAALITGSIRWDPVIISHVPAHELDLFSITLFTLVDGATVVLKTAKEKTRPVPAGKLMQVDYEILDPPLSTDLRIQVSYPSGAFVNHLVLGAGVVPVDFVQVSGPMPVTLTISHEQESAVDFLATVIMPR